MLLLPLKDMYKKMYRIIFVQKDINSGLYVLVRPGEGGGPINVQCIVLISPVRGVLETKTSVW